MASTEHVSINYREKALPCSRKLVFAVLSLAIILLAIYGNSFDCSWQFDDIPNITENPNLHLEEITWQTIRQSLFADRNNPSFPYRPVACFTIALNYYFGGKDVFGYHAVNLVIHWLSAIFLFLFIYHTLNLPKLKQKYADSAYGLALLGTVLWAINPVQVQAVTYIVQRMASLAGMFFILTMYIYLKARTSPSRRRASLFYAMCFVGFVLAVGSKENAIMLPVVIFLYEALLLQDDAVSFIRKNITPILIVLVCTLFMGIGFLYFRGSGNVFSFLKAYETSRPFTLGQRLLTQPRVVLFYISLLLYPLPSRLNIAHSFELSESLFDPPSTFFSILAIFLLIFFALYLARRRPLFSFCVLFFFVNHVIESSIFPLEIAYEHRNYTPSMLFFLPFTIGLMTLIERYKTNNVMYYTLVAFIALLLIGFGHAAYLRNFDWKTPKTLWSDAVEKSPDISRPYHNLGKYYHDRGYPKRALEFYQKALEKPVNNRKTELFVTYYNLGKVWVELRDYARAESFFKQAIHMNASYWPAYNDLATCYDSQGKDDLVHQSLVKAFKLSPYAPITNLNLGLYYLRHRRPEQALRHLKQAVSEKELGPKAVLHMAIAHKQEHRLGRAAVLFQQAIREKPRDVKSHLHLAEVYLKAGHKTRAIMEAEQAVGLIPSKDVFQKILDDILATDSTGNIQPAGSIVIPLLEETLRRKANILNEWGELLKETSQASMNETRQQ
jgi:tetratricopeptide (TPR) repeat protein